MTTGSLPRRRRLWPRFAIAVVLIVSVTATATATASLLYLHEIATHLGKIPGVQRELLPAEEGAPQTFLILGSDKRASEQGTKWGNSDTVMLMRIDPNSHLITMLSIPRDLKVNIPGYGVSKFNAAYSYGGPKLALKMVEKVTGVVPNHVIDVDFLGFARAVDAIGCVYTQVDQRYYHSNAGLPPEEQYSEINIEPGYQKLCGKDALAFVRYRHTDTDLVREARQQEFLRQVRAQVPAGEIFFGDREKLVEIFTHYTSSDIHSTTALISAINLIVAARGSEVEQVHFPAILIPLVPGEPDYVYDNPAAVHAAVDRFLGKDRQSHGVGSTGKKKAHAAARHAGHHRPAPPSEPAPEAALTEAAEYGRETTAALAPQLKPRMPLFYLRDLPPGTEYVDTRATTSMSKAPAARPTSRSSRNPASPTTSTCRDRRLGQPADPLRPYRNPQPRRPRNGDLRRLRQRSA